MVYQPTYFPTIETFKHLVGDDHIIFETFDHYQKQTYRTRCSIYAANGKLDLIIPIKHAKDHRQFTKDVRIENDFNWQKNHFKSLENAYRSSPFFEYYEDEIISIYASKDQFLLDFLFKTIDLSFKLTNISKEYSQTSEFFMTYKEVNDLRPLADFKSSKTPKIDPYIQVFDNKHGFISNLSILDLLFNEGPNALNYLEKL